MKKMFVKVKKIITGNEGASNIEIIVWISVVLVIATVLFLFRDSITGFINKAITEIGNFKVK